MIKSEIQIIIIDDSSIKKCDASCGIDWSSAEAIALANQQIKARFGDRVELKYLDLSKTALDHQVLVWQQKIRSKNLLPPLLVINGEVRISGQFDIRMLLDTIDTEIEIKQ